jgi:hypothetical protein
LGDVGRVKVSPDTLPPAHSWTLKLGLTEVQVPLPTGLRARVKVDEAMARNIFLAIIFAF